MKLTIRALGLARSTEARGSSLRLAGGVLAALAGGVRRVTLRVRPAPPDHPRATLTIERTGQVSAYQLEGRPARWLLAASSALRGAP